MAEGGPLESPLRRDFGPANLYLLDDAQLARMFRTIARAMPRPDAIAIGMAGARTAADHARLRRVAAGVWRAVPCYATSDLETGLMAADDRSPRRRGATGSDSILPRVLVVSGTGSCCFARRPDGQTGRLGGWGHLLGDRASGYDIAMRTLRAVVRVHDHAGAMPRVGQRILAALLLNEPEDLVAWAQGASKPEIAALAREVFDAAADGDRVAREVITTAAQTLADDAAACARLVAVPGTAVQFVLAGSVILEQPGFTAAIRREIRSRWPRAVVSTLSRDSVWGALELARRQLRLSRAGTVSPAPPSRGRAAMGANASPSTARDAAAARTVTAVPSLASLVESPTEQRNPRSRDLDRLPLGDAVALMLTEDQRIPPALMAQRTQIEAATRLIVRAFKRGGRLIYAGAGTSGRLGVLDASECPPTFRTPRGTVQGIIAGGPTALWSAVEGAEDDGEAGRRAVAGRGVRERDVVVGIAASGRTPFVWGALGEARRRGAATVLLCFNPALRIARRDRPTVVIAPDVGPEILTGSTRLKAGTATKLVLNVFTTLSMVQLGKVRSNLMVDVNASNVKLRDRAVRMVQELTQVDPDTARAALERANWGVREACGVASRTRPRRQRPPPAPTSRRR